jgi:hypothetical protein
MLNLPEDADAIRSRKAGLVDGIGSKWDALG